MNLKNEHLHIVTEHKTQLKYEISAVIIRVI